MIDEMIQGLMPKVGQWQLTEGEYHYIASYLGDVNFFVFGLGHDTELWRYANKEGKTLFVEHDENWMVYRDDVLKVEYTCKLWQWEKLFEEMKAGIYDNLEITLPDEVRKTKWDVIFVDSPQGYNDGCIGRMQSIFTAWQLASKETIVFIHDCDRQVEDVFSKELFTIEEQTKKLRKCAKK
jgi:uncharacterized protein (TIGR01627 family)